MRYLVLILLLISCHPVSHIVVGNKREAASLGANGILIVNTDNKTYQSINSNENGVQTSTYEEKFIKAIAIHVPEI